MDSIRKAIAAFWNGTATKNEQQQLLSDLITRHKEWRSALAEEFDDAANHAEAPLGEQKSAELLQHIHARLDVRREPVHIRWWKTKWAVAAMAILSCAVSWYLLDVTGQVKESTPGYAEAVTRQVSNPGSDTLHFKMPDGSSISLSPSSTVSYTDDYGLTARALTLEGEAKFTVVRDTALPFVVSANGYTTTALGTAFVIDTRQTGKTLVRLLTGKVVVRSTKASLVAMEDTFLLPGDEVQINGIEGAVAVKRKPKAAQAPKSPIKALRPAVPLDTTGALQFEQTPLAAVFDHVAARMKTTIVVTKTDLKGLSFTGSFELTDSLEVMLSVICQMNDLVHEYQDGQVIIRKKQTGTQ
ncbi:FecR domain-containing protein [Parapedobacter sp. ISTM3]|uniref:FecR family protein n=1 Tax=Parapedobacter sp. ISTM3 TaxID=2800130 RepID=UPI0019081730|nr:FecR domain-containing protein [Parapedobacter sp. ISTM3]MBK1438847.1 FecR domain-containing protein [Parapedobacter sp. ISTM3]